jgi:hypothetical protein
MSLDSCIGQTVRAYLFKNSNAELRFEYQTLGSTIDFPVPLEEGDLELDAIEVEITKATPGWASGWSASSYENPFEIAFLEVTHNNLPRKAFAYLTELTCAAEPSPTTTPTDGEEPAQLLDNPPPPEESCSPDGESGISDQASGAVPSWGVNFEYLDSTERKKRWSLALLPAMQSNIRYSGGTDVPGALPGLSFRTIPSIARHKVPGFQPVYQHMGIDSVTVTMVGCFTGADGAEEGNLRSNFDGVSAVLLGDEAEQRITLIKRLDSYKSFQDFYRISVQQGRELTVELNISGSGKFNPAEDDEVCTGLRNSRGNPQFKALVKRMDTYYTRSDRTWYTIDLEITDYRLISDRPIALLRPREPLPSDTDPTSGNPGDLRPATEPPSNSYRGRYYLWNREIRESSLKKYETLKRENEGVIFEWEASRIVYQEVTQRGLRPYPPDAQATRNCSLGGLDLKLSVSDLNSEGILTRDLEAIYPCNILGRRTLFRGNIGSSEARVIQVNSWGEDHYGLHKDDLMTVTGSFNKGIINLIGIIVGCATSSVLLATSIAGNGLLAFFSVGTWTPIGIALITAAALNATYQCGIALTTLYSLAKTVSSSSKEEQNRATVQWMDREGESRTWLWTIVHALLDLLPFAAGFIIAPLRPFVEPLINLLKNNKLSRGIINRLSNSPYAGTLVRYLVNYFRNSQAITKIINLVPIPNPQGLSINRIRQLVNRIRSLDSSFLAKIEIYVTNLPESKRIQFLNRLDIFLEKDIPKGSNFTEQNLLDLFNSFDPNISYTRISPSRIFPVPPANAPLPTYIRLLDNNEITDLVNDLLRQGKTQTFIDQFILKLRTLPPGTWYDAGDISSEVVQSLQRLGFSIRYNNSGGVIVVMPPPVVGSVTLPSTSPNSTSLPVMPPQGSISSSAPVSTPQPQPPSPRQTPPASPMIPRVIKLIDAEINDIEVAFRGDRVNIFTGGNSSDVDGFLNDLRRDALPSTGRWQFAYLRGRRPSGRLIELLKSLGFKVTESRRLAGPLAQWTVFVEPPI